MQMELDDLKWNENYSIPIYFGLHFQENDEVVYMWRNFQI